MTDHSAQRPQPLHDLAAIGSVRTTRPPQSAHRVGNVRITACNVAPSDRMISVTRQRIIAAAKEFAASGKLPPSARDPSICRGARGGAFIAPDSMDWLEAYARNLREIEVPGVVRQAAE